MQNQLMSWSDAIVQALQSFVQDIIAVLPNIIAAIIVLVVGLLLSVLLGHVAKKLIDLTTLDVLPMLLEALQHAGIEIRDLVVRNRTLEDVFIQLTGRRLLE